MKINIICIGKIKEKYLIDAILEYKKRISRYLDIDIIELKEELASIENESNIDNSKEVEGKRILDKLDTLIGNDKTKTVNFACAIDGKEYTTIDFEKKIENYKLDGKSNINFIIGGSYGLSSEVLRRVEEKISFSKLTFPHQLFRVILLEQIYRISKIKAGEPYHK